MTIHFKFMMINSTDWLHQRTLKELMEILINSREISMNFITSFIIKVNSWSTIFFILLKQPITYIGLFESIPDAHSILEDLVDSNIVSVPTASASNSQTESTSKTQSASLKTESPISEIFEEAICPNESRVDVVNKKVVQECRKKVSVFTRDQLAKSPEITKLVKEIIKTRDGGSPAKIEAVVDWIEDTFRFSNLCEANKRKLLPIVIYFLFKSKYETMLRKMLACLGISRRNKKCKEDRQWLYSLDQMKNEVANSSKFEIVDITNYFNNQILLNQRKWFLLDNFKSYKFYEY